MVGQEFQAKAAGQRLHVVLHQQRPLHHHLPPHHHPRAQGANVRPAGWETPFYLCLLATQDTTGASTVHNQFFSFFGFVTIFVFPARWDGLPRWTAPPPAPPPSSQTKIETSLNSGLLSGDPSFSSILDHYSFVFSLFICFDVRKSPGLCSAVFPPSSPSPRSCSTLEGFTIQVLKPSKGKTWHDLTNQMTKKNIQTLSKTDPRGLRSLVKTMADMILTVYSDPAMKSDIWKSSSRATYHVSLPVLPPP